jgi:hypothetical protein
MAVTPLSRSRRRGRRANYPLNASANHLAAFIFQFHGVTAEDIATISQRQLPGHSHESRE